MDGVINVYKKKGYTSHDVAAIIKRLTGEKTGHAGTLDPDAEGVLVILVGKGTKLSDYLMSGDKEYRATVRFGAVTDTFDGSGEILETRDVNFTEEELKEAVDGFIGGQSQIPPMYSAIKKDGKKLYDLARKGTVVEREARNVFISDIYVEQFNGHDEAVLYIKCGKGTYIRSICHDLGQELGCGAYMSELTRTKSGGFCCEDGVTVEELKSLYEKEGRRGLERVLISLDEALSGYNNLTVRADAEKQLYNGAKIEQRVIKTPVKIDDMNILYDERGNLIGIYEAVNKENGEILLKPKTMIFRKS